MLNLGLGIGSKNYILRVSFYCARLENLISAVGQSWQHFGAAKPFAIVAQQYPSLQRTAARISGGLAHRKHRRVINFAQSIAFI
jgi:hypothetical protein